MKRWLARYINRTTIFCAAGLAVVVLSTIWSSQRTSSRVDQAIRQNFVGAGMLSQLQVEGERMRRFEKEMFIYVAVPSKRAGYVKEFRDAYDKSLVLLDTMLAPSGRVFTDAEREKIAAWKAASAFYYGEFDRLARRAETLNTSGLSSEQRATLSVEFNDGIKDGKDRFRELLNGTATMRAEKERQSAAIAVEIDAFFDQMLRFVVLVALAITVGIALTSASGTRTPSFRTTRGTGGSPLSPAAGNTLDTHG